MIDLAKPSATEAMNGAESTVTAPARRPYEPPQCEKKRSIHRVTLISGMGVVSMGTISMTG